MKTFNFHSREILTKISSSYSHACNSFSQAIHDDNFLKSEIFLKTRNPQCRFLFQIDKNEKSSPKKIAEQSQSIFKELCSAAAGLVKITADNLKNNL